MQYAIYARKSTESDERQIQSIEDQLRLDLELCTKLGISITPEYTFTESKSAHEPDNRPQFSKMMSLVLEGKINGLVAWHPDRISRNEIDAAKITYLVRKGKLKLVFVNYHFDDSPEGLMMLQMALSQAQYSSSKLSKDVKRGINSKLDKEVPPHYCPQGYLNNKADHTIEVDNERFKLLRGAWDLMLTGAYTVPQIYEFLVRDWGYKARPTEKNPNGVLSRNGLYGVFNNVFYTGYYSHNKQIFKGNYVPMITPDEFNQVQRILKRKGKQQSKKRDFAYTGLMFCKNCGCQVTAEHQTGRHNKGDYIYYHCSNGKRICNKRSTPEDKLELQIDKILQSITIDEDFRDLALREIAKWQKTESTSTQSIYEAQHRNLEAAQKKLDNLLQLRLTDVINDEVYTSQQDKLLAEINKAKEEIGAIDNDFERIRSTAINSFNFAAKARERFLVGSIWDKREIATALGITYEFDKGEITIAEHPAVKLPKYITTVGTIEPPTNSSESIKKTDFLSSVSFGWSAGTLSEPLRVLWNAALGGSALPSWR